MGPMQTLSEEVEIFISWVRAQLQTLKNFSIHQHMVSASLLVKTGDKQEEGDRIVKLTLIYRFHL